MEYGITAKEKKDAIHYFISWSPLSLVDRWEINAKVPSIAGIYEIYWMDDHKHLRIFDLGQTHYGGLRSELRRLTDPELCGNPQTKAILEDKEVWYRYTTSNSTNTMTDVIWFFWKTYFPENPPVQDSGRYKKIFITESEPNKLIWVP
jgi:hypothetical protein